MMNFNLLIVFLIYLNILKSSGQESNYKNLSAVVYHAKEEIKPENVVTVTEGNVITKDEKTTTGGDELLEDDLFNNHTTSVFRNNINADAVFRGFYVVLGIGSIFLVYIGIKTFRLRRYRAENRYKVLPTKYEDHEAFYPLAADEGEDEEIFNASNPHGTYS